jgi:hypothetical protein
MPYNQVAIPYRGISIDAGYSSLLAGFTSECMNVVPYDTFKGKLRLGKRKPLLGAYTFNDTPTAITRQVQVILRADAYVSGTLTQRCVVVAGGEVYVIDNGGTKQHCGRGALAAMNSTGSIGAAVFGQFCYFADGARYRKIDITASSPTVVDWTGPYANVGSAGDYATLLVRFGGRLALSGVKASPNNWFLSHINNPDDWHPSAGNIHDAVAGASSTRFGVPGEPIVALIPVGESGLMFAGRHSISYLTADPVIDTARIIELSRSVGIVSANAWCASDSQTMYMLAQDGLYRVRPNDFQVTQSNRVTGGRLDTFFQQQSFENLNCSLGFDAEAQNIYLVLSRTDQPNSSVHLIYNQTTDSFWPWSTGWTSFAAPTVCGEFPFGDARSPLIAFGSSNGFIAWFDRDLVSGVDGQAAVGYKGAAAEFSVTNALAAVRRVYSVLTLGPVVEPSLGQVMIRDVRVELSMDSPIENPIFSTPVQQLTGPVATILSGQTAEEAIGANIASVTVQFDPLYPLVVVDGGSHLAFTPTATYDCGAPNTVWSTAVDQALDLLFDAEIAGTYNTADSLITDPGDRTYAKTTNRFRNTTPGTPTYDWYLEHLPTVGSVESQFRRDETFGNTSAQTPSGTYLYRSEERDNNFLLPSDIVAPRLLVSSAVYETATRTNLGTLIPGRNDALRCRVREQSAYVRLESNGVPWALERMAVLVDAMQHTKNVKGTY